MAQVAEDPQLLPPRDVLEPVEALFRDLRSRPDGLTSREAARRLVAYGPNELTRRGGAHWPAQLARQFTHPLALLLFLAAGLAFVSSMPVLGVAVLAVIVLNALFAFAQERQAERAVEALRRYLPQRASVLRDGERTEVDAAQLVPGRPSRTAATMVAKLSSVSTRSLGRSRGLTGTDVAREASTTRRWDGASSRSRSASAIGGVEAALLPPLQQIFGTRPLGAPEVGLLCLFPVVVWGSDELRRAWLRRRAFSNRGARI